MSSLGEMLDSLPSVVAIEEPFDVVPYLVFCDWLEENDCPCIPVFLREFCASDSRYVHEALPRWKRFIANKGLQQAEAYADMLVEQRESIEQRENRAV